MSNRNDLIKCTGILILAQGIMVLQAVTVISDNANLTSIPQDMDTAVRSLSLQYNDLSSINNGSFPLYPRLQKLFMSHNPLTAIHSGTFDHNPKLRAFLCDFCALHIFPLDFGPASKSLSKLDLIFGIQNISAFRQMRLERFTSLKRLGLYGVKTDDVNIIKFPTSITNLGLGKMRLTTFPNLTLELLPNLKIAMLEKNTFQEASNFVGVTETLEALYIKSSNLHCADGLDLLPNLAILEIQNNKLETLPDMLEIPNIRKLYINGNSRMNCDHRLCWRRLWDRVRKPLPDSDDVTCVEPPLLTGQAMSTVNPKFMHCSNDSRFSSFFQGPSYFSTNRGVPVNATINTMRFHKDFNYDTVINHALSNSIAVSARSQAECSAMCLQKQGCYGIYFNESVTLGYENCRLLGQTNCGLINCT